MPATDINTFGTTRRTAYNQALISYKTFQRSAESSHEGRQSSEISRKSQFLLAFNGFASAVFAPSATDEDEVDDQDIKDGLQSLVSLAGKVLSEEELKSPEVVKAKSWVTKFLLT